MHLQKTELLFLLTFHFLLMRFDDRARNICRYDIVVIQLHGEVAASARDGAKLRGVASHF